MATKERTECARNKFIVSNGADRLKNKQRGCDMTNLAFIMDVQEIIATGATRIFMTGVEINHDTMMKYLNDRLTFALISENKQLENTLRIAIEMVENNKGKL
ncbi:hypothetical protein D3C81_131640 [compost metagenome]